MEEYAYVLDFMPEGGAYDTAREPLVQLVGERFFTLLLASTKRDSFIVAGTRLFIGKGQRDVVEKIKRKIEYEDLTNSAKSNLDIVIAKIVKEREKEFVDFINKAGPITARIHQLELLPMVGKKHVEAILKEREQKPFESCEDIRKRIGIDPVKIFTARIINELQGKEKYYLFSKPPIERFRRR